RFFAEIRWTGGHRASLAALRAGLADIAAIDAVSLALLRRHAPTEIEGLRVLAWSAAAPALPYASRRGIDDGLRRRLTAGLLAAAVDPGGAEARAALLLAGLQPADDADYAAI